MAAKAATVTLELSELSGWSGIASQATSAFPRKHRGLHRAPKEIARNLLISLLVLTVSLSYAFALVTLHRYYGSTSAIIEHQTVLEQQFSTGSGIGAIKEHVAPPPGWAVARLIIPKLKQKWIVVEGTTDSDIATAPGHYAGTALPGQRGNFAVAGHRSPAIFSDLDNLHDGDIIQVEVNISSGKVRRYTYTMINSEIVNPDRLDVIAANPDNLGTKATKKLLTLTTCDPWWDRTHRLIIRAQLTKTETLNG